jgi:hypothetical protein
MYEGGCEAHLCFPGLGAHSLMNSRSIFTPIEACLCFMVLCCDVIHSFFIIYLSPSQSICWSFSLVALFFYFANKVAGVPVHHMLLPSRLPFFSSSFALPFFIIHLAFFILSHFLSIFVVVLVERSSRTFSHFNIFSFSFKISNWVF